MSTLPLLGPQRGRDGRRPGGGNKDGTIFRVGQLNRIVRLQLEDRFHNIWVQGELSNTSRPTSGHLYFTLNDEKENAQLQGVMFRSDARRARAKLENGALVKLRGTLSLFEPRGAYQFIARVALPAGLGDLHAQFEAVRVRLEAEGLLAKERKRVLPRIPRAVGVVTSRSGAALHDIVVVAQRRCPTRIILSPCLVQGPDAPKAIIEALEAIQRQPEVEVVIVGRGGGASEDLVAFNDERVARAIAACRVPTVSAVGHEVDVTIADLVADVRAATPSNAAELVVPDRETLLAQLEAMERRLGHAAHMRLARARLNLDQQARRVRDPRNLSAQGRRDLSAFRRRLELLSAARLRTLRRRLVSIEARLARENPQLQTSRRRAALSALQGRLHERIYQQLRDRRARLLQYAARLHALSPLAVLARGYAIALREDGRALLRASETQPGERLELRLHEGRVRTRVEPW